VRKMAGMESWSVTCTHDDKGPLVVFWSPSSPGREARTPEELPAEVLAALAPRDVRRALRHLGVLEAQLPPLPAPARPPRAPRPPRPPAPRPPREERPERVLTACERELERFGRIKAEASKLLKILSALEAEQTRTVKAATLS
jgi:hypothetical protein